MVLRIERGAFFVNPWVWRAAQGEDYEDHLWKKSESKTPVTRAMGSGKVGHHFEGPSQLPRSEGNSWERRGAGVGK